MYYVRARYYDQNIRRFINRDVVSGDITNSSSLNRYCYVQGNPVSLMDPFGLCPDGNSALMGLAGSAMNMMDGVSGATDRMKRPRSKISTYGHIALDWLGNYWSGANSLNELWYEIEESGISALGYAVLGLAGIVWDVADLVNAAWYALEGNYEMAVVSAICALPYVGSLVGGTAGLAIQFVGYGMTLGMGVKGTTEAVDRAVESYRNGTLGWWNALDIGLNGLTVGFAGAALYSVGSKLNRIGALGNNGGYADLGGNQGGSYFPQNQTSLWGQEKYVTEKGLNTVKQHLSGKFADEFNDAMINRLEIAYKNNTKISGADLDFYTHEIYEYNMMKSGMSYRNAHEAAKAYYNATEFNFYHPEVIKQNPRVFNDAWFKFWGIERN